MPALDLLYPAAVAGVALGAAAGAGILLATATGQWTVPSTRQLTKAPVATCDRTVVSTEWLAAWAGSAAGRWMPAWALQRRPQASAPVDISSRYSMTWQETLITASTMVLRMPLVLCITLLVLAVGISLSWMVDPALAAAQRGSPAGKLVLRALLCVLRWAVRALLLGLGVCHIETVGKQDEHVRIAVSNHTSFLETLVLPPLGYGPLAKSGVFSVPLVGPAIRALGGLPVDRSSTASRAATRQAILERAAHNGAPPLLIFPEGTTGERGLRAFKSGAFIPGVPVQPVLVQYPCPPWRQTSPALVHAGPPIAELFLRCVIQPYVPVRVAFLPTYYPSPQEQAHPAAFAEGVRGYMASAAAYLWAKEHPGRVPADLLHMHDAPFAAALHRRGCAPVLRAPKSSPERKRSRTKAPVSPQLTASVPSQDLVINTRAVYSRARTVHVSADGWIHALPERPPQSYASHDDITEVAQHLVPGYHPPGKKLKHVATAPAGDMAQAAGAAAAAGAGHARRAHHLGMLDSHSSMQLGSKLPAAAELRVPWHGTCIPMTEYSFDDVRLGYVTEAAGLPASVGATVELQTLADIAPAAGHFANAELCAATFCQMKQPSLRAAARGAVPAAGDVYCAAAPDARSCASSRSSTTSGAQPLSPALWTPNPAERITALSLGTRARAAGLAAIPEQGAQLDSPDLQPDHVTWRMACGGTIERAAWMLRRAPSIGRRAWHSLLHRAQLAAQRAQEREAQARDAKWGVLTADDWVQSFIPYTQRATNSTLSAGLSPSSASSQSIDSADCADSSTRAPACEYVEQALGLRRAAVLLGEALVRPGAKQQLQAWNQHLLLALASQPLEGEVSLEGVRAVVQARLFTMVASAPDVQTSWQKQAVALADPEVGHGSGESSTTSYSTAVVQQRATPKPATVPDRARDSVNSDSTFMRETEHLAAYLLLPDDAAPPTQLPLPVLPSVSSQPAGAGFSGPVGPSRACNNTQRALCRAPIAEAGVTLRDFAVLYTAAAGMQAPCCSAAQAWASQARLLACALSQRAMAQCAWAAQDPAQALLLSEPSISLPLLWRAVAWELAKCVNIGICAPHDVPKVDTDEHESRALLQWARWGNMAARSVEFVPERSLALAAAEAEMPSTEAAMTSAAASAGSSPAAVVAAIQQRQRVGPATAVVAAASHMMSALFEMEADYEGSHCVACADMAAHLLSLPVGEWQQQTWARVAQQVLVPGA